MCSIDEDAERPAQYAAKGLKEAGVMDPEKKVVFYRNGIWGVVHRNPSVDELVRLTGKKFNPGEKCVFFEYSTGRRTTIVPRKAVSSEPTT